MTQHLEETATRPRTGLLSSMSVTDLFGHYSYDLEVPASGADPSRLMLLHGDNGSGKTTILRLLWNALSPADNRQHRTRIARTPFRAFEARFSDGTILSVTKTEELLGPFEYKVAGPSANLSAVYDVDSANTVRSIAANSAAARYLESARWREGVTLGGGQPLFTVGEYPFTAEAEQSEIIMFLEREGFAPVFLADDRNLYADDEELERLRERMSPSLPGAYDPRQPTQDVMSRELTITLRRVNDWLRTLTLSGQNIGSAGANSIYQDVLEQLASNAGDSKETPAGQFRDDLIKTLEVIRQRSPRYEEFELVPHFAADRFIGSLLAINDPGRERLAAEILSPYFESVMKRYEALEHAESLVRSLMDLVNRFFIDKQVTFSPNAGIRILSRDGVHLEPDALSSGERQLVMLLCTTLLAGRDSRLFIIDEPELSLGVDWQREILGDLLELTSGTALQFVVATHSIEVMTGQAESLVRLTRR